MTTNISTTRSDGYFHVACLLLGQTLTAMATFFWNANGRHSSEASVLIILSMVFFLAGLPGIFSLFKTRFPIYSKAGFVYAVYGCVGGIAFGFEGLYSSILFQDQKIGVEAFKLAPWAMNLTLFWSGPAFPLTLIILSVMLLYSRISTRTTALLILAAGIGFPVTRILRIEWLAHVDDIVLLVAIAMLGKEIATNDR